MELPHSSSVRVTPLILWILLGSLQATSQTSHTPPRVKGRVDREKLVTLRGNTHPLARAEYDRGVAPDSLPAARMLLLLQRAPEQESALRQLLDDQQVKDSSQYHKWLSPSQFGEQFGPADADIQAVTDWLASEGFEINRVAAGRTVIEFSGTAGLVRQALHTEMHRYAVNGAEHWANTADPQIPTALAPVIAGVVSLNNFPRKPLYHQLGTFSRSKLTGEVKPLFTFTNTYGTYFGFGPGDFATTYDVLPLWQSGIDGSGQTIAVVSPTNINLQDARDFRAMFGLPPKDPQIIVNGLDPGLVPGYESEADLDVQWAGGVAKGAVIDLVVSQSTETSAGVDLSALYIVDNNLAPILSESYGMCEAFLGAAGNAFYNALWQQAAAQGITVLVASGDQGSAMCEAYGAEEAAHLGLSVNGIASTPFNIAVGGTDFDDRSNPDQYWSNTNSLPYHTSAKSYVPETTLNNSCAENGFNGCQIIDNYGMDRFASGGGPSNCIVPTAFPPAVACGTADNGITGYSKPAWQTGAGVPKDGVRDLPDVSLFSGNGKAYAASIFCEMDVNPGSVLSCDLSAPYQNFQAGGGSSFSAQTFAGIMALVLQKTGERQGNVNYVLYKLAAQNGASCPVGVGTSSSCVFHDVVSGNNSVACINGTPNCNGDGYFGIMVDPDSVSSPAWLATSGYDRATGLGTIDAANLVNNWTSVTFTPSKTALNLSPTTLAHGQSVKVDVSVTSASGTPTGAVSLVGPHNGAPGITSLALSNGSAASETALLPGGAYTVTAHYPGDGNFGASDSDPIQVTVSKENSLPHIGIVTFLWNSGVITNTNASTVPYGSPYILRVDVTNKVGQSCASMEQQVPQFSCPTGTVGVTDNGNPLDLGVYSLNSQGYTEDIPIQLAGGQHSIVATYSGDVSFNASASPTGLVLVTPAETEMRVTSSQSGESATLVATVSGPTSNGAAPTGTVTFASGTSPITGAVNYLGTPFSHLTRIPPSLTATLTASFSATTTVNVRYSGDQNYTSSSGSTTITGTPDFSFALKSTTASVTAGNSASFPMSLSGAWGFSSPVTLSCAVNAPVGVAQYLPACAMNPSSVTPTDKAVTSNLTVSTTARSLIPLSTFREGTRQFSYPLILVLFILLTFGIHFMAASKRWRLAQAAVIMLAVSLLLLSSSCGGGGNNGGGGGGQTGTPAGQYTITVTGTSGQISHTAQVTLTVQ